MNTEKEVAAYRFEYRQMFDGRIRCFRIWKDTEGGLHEDLMPTEDEVRAEKIQKCSFITGGVLFVLTFLFLISGIDFGTVLAGALGAGLSGLAIGWLIGFFFT